MAEVVQEKSRGLKFAEQQLLRHGWEHGKGLGRAENGISEAIKVKVKCDKGGVGHKEGEQFTFHWWDHVFNKASSSLQNGIKLKKTVEDDEEDGMISNKKPRKSTLAKAKLYGCFVKSATLLSGQEQSQPKSSDSPDSSSSSSDEEDDQKLDLSSNTKLSDADLMKACGGRTAHKGARHGLTMSAKLARLEQQEAEFMAKYSKKSQPESAAPVCVTPTSQLEKLDKTMEDCSRKKMKKKRSAERIDELNGDKVSESPETDVQSKKKKKKKKKKSEVTVDVSTEGDLNGTENGEVGDSHKTKRKHKKKKDNTEQNGDETAELHIDTKVKKKKKSSKHHSEPKEEEESNNKDSSWSEDVVLEESAVKQKRKKCKKDKSVMDNNVDEQVPPPKKKTKKSKD
ncbi:G patch domain-containing protein 4 isoform X2 [Stegastes partitus]|uniref:G patch domain-containing protein 4 n=1 Tax=Stegastes partitus TaxID=144197 RepID=A0A9Y4N8P1_9TELE|nr:PREDICTED: G patch domain-containing protein 4 isoform X2 [Stegastes partitus]